MFNLLPDDLKSKIKKEYRTRRFIVVVISVIFIQLLFLALLLPSWFMSEYKEKDAVVQRERMNQSDLNTNASSTTNTIKSINQRLLIVNTSLQYPKFVPFINNVISRKTKSILINQFFYTANSSTTATLSISGISDTRESLVSFKKKLDDSKLFKSIDLPISNLAKDKNINFSMSIVIAQ